jgi:Zn finger protein HypA/HybF involved in hydrogenase expression
MVTIVKHEWHQHDRQYAIELDETLLSEIYPDLDEDEIATMLKQIEDGEIDYEEVINDAWENDVEIEWEFQYDDCWTDRKGGYDVTYELGDESSWVEPDKEPEPTHKCTKCRWTGQSYQTLTAHLREDGTVIENYYQSDEESHHTNDTCPMCDSDTELTEVGIQEEKERAERHARWEQEAKDSEEEVPCFSCGAMHKESELPEMSGQYHCPDCHEGWVMMESREEDTVDDYELEEALEELKAEFEALVATANIVPMKCTECDWTGDWSETNNNDDDEDICPECGSLVVDSEDDQSK